MSKTPHEIAELLVFYPYMQFDDKQNANEVEAAAEAINQLIIEAKIEELNAHRSLTGIYKGGISETSDDVEDRIAELQQSLKESK